MAWHALKPHGHGLDTLVVLHRDDACIQLSRTLMRAQLDVIVVLERQCRLENRMLAAAEFHYDGFAKLRISRATCGYIRRNANWADHLKESRKLRRATFTAFGNHRVADRFHAVYRRMSASARTDLLPKQTDSNTDTTSRSNLCTPDAKFRRMFRSVKMLKGRGLEFSVAARLWFCLTLKQARLTVFVRRPRSPSQFPSLRSASQPKPARLRPSPQCCSASACGIASHG